MNENGTIKQLSEALNQLLTAYEKSQEVNTNLNKDIATLKTEIENLEEKNMEQEDVISSLSNAENSNTSVMDGMLSRISSILNTSNKEETVAEIPVVTVSETPVVTVGEQLEETISTQTQDEVDELSEDIANDIVNEVVQEVEQNKVEENNYTTHKTSDVVDINSDDLLKNEKSTLDLGRMQSLLNGMN